MLTSSEQNRTAILLEGYSRKSLANNSLYPPRNHWLESQIGLQLFYFYRDYMEKERSADFFSNKLALALPLGRKNSRRTSLTKWAASNSPALTLLPRFVGMARPYQPVYTWSWCLERTRSSASSGSSAKSHVPKPIYHTLDQCKCKK